MNIQRIRASALMAFPTFVLLGMAAAGANAAQPVTHGSGTAGSSRVVHVPGTKTVSTTIYESMSRGGALMRLGNQ